MPWITYLWPGLTQLWSAGAWSGLAVAIGFTALVNLLALTTFVWVEVLGASLVRVGWVAAAALWVGAAVLSRRWVRRQTGKIAGSSSGDLFPAAVGEYLQGNWYEAETILGRLLRTNPRDIESRLMLATLLRHTRRFQEARDQLARLDRLEGAAEWQTEIAAERQRVGQVTPRPVADSGTAVSDAARAA